MSKEIKSELLKELEIHTISNTTSGVSYTDISTSGGYIAGQTCYKNTINIYTNNTGKTIKYIPGTCTSSPGDYLLASSASLMGIKVLEPGESVTVSFSWSWNNAGSKCPYNGYTGHSVSINYTFYVIY